MRYGDNAAAELAEFTAAYLSSCVAGRRIARPGVPAPAPTVRLDFFAFPHGHEQERP